MRKTNVACAKKWADCALVLHIKSFKMVFLKLVHTEYQVNHKTQPFWVKVQCVIINKSDDKKTVSKLTSVKYP